jgi:exopolysaccharide biosynthesis protein
LWIIETRRELRAFHSSRDVPTLRKRLASAPGAVLLVNGGYHDGDYARPRVEGLLRIGNRTFGALKPADLQLTHVLSIDSNGSIAEIEPASTTSLAARAADQDQIQSGPLILDAGSVAINAITRSVNGADPYKRTAIGRTRAGDTIIVVARTPHALTELARIVAGTNRYAERGLTLVNLDGGPSTGIHSETVPQLSYGADKVTPVGFAIE